MRSGSSLSFEPKSEPSQLDKIDSKVQDIQKKARAQYSCLELMRKEMKDQHRETDNKILKFQHEMMGPSTWIAEEKPNLKK